MLRTRLVRPLSPRRRIVHLVAGALLPLVFLVVDPAVFRAGSLMLLGESYLGAYRAFGYAATAVAALLLLRAIHVSSTGELEAGMLYGAAGVALALGLVLLPLSLLGLVLYGLGLLGLSPFAAAWVYFRNAARQHTEATGRLMSARGAAGIALFVIMALSVHVLVNGIVRWGVKEESRIALRSMRWLYDADALVVRYRESKSVDEQRRLAVAFKMMTGEELATRLVELND